jgi:hypothetical protein
MLTGPFFGPVVPADFYQATPPRVPVALLKNKFPDPANREGSLPNPQRMKEGIVPKTCSAKKP